MDDVTSLILVPLTVDGLEIPVVAGEGSAMPAVSLQP
jgi:hypothetical protein